MTEFEGRVIVAAQEWLDARSMHLCGGLISGKFDPLAYERLAKAEGDLAAAVRNLARAAV
jgi:hypothetical protein